MNYGMVFSQFGKDSQKYLRNVVDKVNHLISTQFHWVLCHSVHGPIWSPPHTQWFLTEKIKGSQQGHKMHHNDGNNSFLGSLLVLPVEL